MEGAANVKILFVAGFGPIVRDTGESRKLYGEVLGIPFKEESDSYLHTEALQGAKTFALWPIRTRKSQQIRIADYAHGRAI